MNRTTIWAFHQSSIMAPKDEKQVDKIFAGCLDNLPPLSSKVMKEVFCTHTTIHIIYNINLRWWEFSPVPPSLTCWWRGTPWWSGCTPRSRTTARRSTGWSSRWWTWGGGSGMRWPMSMPPQPSVWMSSEDVRSSVWDQTLSTLGPRNMDTGSHWFIKF